MAPEAVFALLGIILGSGSGSVYGTRNSGIAWWFGSSIVASPRLSSAPVQRAGAGGGERETLVFEAEQPLMMRLGHRPTARLRLVSVNRWWGPHLRGLIAEISCDGQRGGAAPRAAVATIFRRMQDFIDY